MNTPFARQVRLHRLYRRHERRLFVVPLDHSVTNGPLTGGRSLDQLVGLLATNGVDAVVLHKGALRHVDHRWFTHTSLIVHLSASTMHAPDPDAKYLVSSVEESLRLGADAVSVHVNLGSLNERRQISDLAAVSEACDRWSMPLLAMMYPRGPKIIDPRDPETVAHAATLGADLGADLVKTIYPGSPDRLAAVTRASSVPVLVAGGPPLDDQDAVLSYVREAIEGGAGGVAMGRNVFGAEHPGPRAHRIADLIHSPTPTSELPSLEMAASTTA